jgi:hypothetical protein
LHDLGIRVAGALIEMDDLSGAAAHLRSLRGRTGESGNRSSGKMATSKALLWLQLGDVDSARECARLCSPDEEATARIILALCDMGDTDYEAALEKWQGLREEMEDEMVGVNAAVCLLYLGRLPEVCFFFFSLCFLFFSPSFSKIFPISLCLFVLTRVIYSRVAQFWKVWSSQAILHTPFSSTCLQCTSCAPRSTRTTSWRWLSV